MTRIEFTDILSVDDALKDKLRQWRNKEKIRKSMLTQHIISKEEHFSWIESLKQKNNQKVWVVFIDNVPIGSVYLQNINHSQLNSEWGYYIGEKDYRGKGLGKRILYKLLLEYFESMKFETLITIVLSRNITALKIYEKCYFRKTEASVTSDNEESIRLEFTKNDWLKHKKELCDECL
jgi:UDP-4-amino-4,6-dideoxy-N-acetyl-beta-L-altrosamine N-acetyltransferase